MGGPADQRGQGLVPKERHHRRAARHFSLSAQETRVAAHVLQGLSWQAIGEHLGISKSAVEAYVTRACAKTGVSSTVQLLLTLHNEAWRQLIAEWPDAVQLGGGPPAGNGRPNHPGDAPRPLGCACNCLVVPQRFHEVSAWMIRRPWDVSTTVCNPSRPDRLQHPA